MSPKKYLTKFKNLAEPGFGRTKKIHIWEHRDIYSKCHEVFINPNQLRTWNSILTYLTNIIDPIFGAIHKLVSIKTKKCVSCFKDLENNGKYIAVGLIKTVKFAANRYKTGSELEMETLMKKNVKRFYSGEIGSTEFRFLNETKKRNLTIIFVLVNGVTCQTPAKVVLTGSDLLAWNITLGFLTKMLDVPAGIQYLTTIYGDLILDPTELQHGYVYVVLPHNEKFVTMNYMKFFTEWEDSKKKGLMLSIRPATVNKAVSYKKVKMKKQRMLEGNESHAIPSNADINAIVAYTAGSVQDPAGGENFQEPLQIVGSPQVDLKSAETQTAYIIQDDTVIFDSQIYILINFEEYNKHKQICPAFPNAKPIIGSMSVDSIPDVVSGDNKVVGNDKKPTIPNSKRTDLENERNVLNWNKSDENKDDVEYISITVTVSKISKALGKSKAKQNSSNVILSKRYETQTNCSNIGVNGTFSEKIKIITHIVNEVIIDTYERLLETEYNNLKNNDNLKPLSIKKEDTRSRDTTTVQNISIQNASDNVGTMKEEDTNKKYVQDEETVNIVNVEKVDEVTFKDVRNSIEIMKDESIGYENSDVQDVNHSSNNSKNKSHPKDYKAYKNNCTQSNCRDIPLVQVQNKTYVNFCDFHKPEKKRPSEDSIIINGNKNTSRSDKTGCPCDVEIIGGKEYKCCFCNIPEVFNLNKSCETNRTDDIKLNLFLPKTSKEESYKAASSVETVPVRQNIITSIENQSSQSINGDTLQMKNPASTKESVSVSQNGNTSVGSQSSQPINEDKTESKNLASSQETVSIGLHSILSVGNQSSQPINGDMLQTKNSDSQKDASNSTETPTQASVEINSQLYSSSDIHGNGKLIEDSISLDSISGVVSDTDNQFKKSPVLKKSNLKLATRSVSFHDNGILILSDNDDIESRYAQLDQNIPEQVEDSKDVISITVNVSKANEPNILSDENNVPIDPVKSPVLLKYTEMDDKQRLGTEEIESNEVYSSKIMLNGTFSEKYEDVKGIVNEILNEAMRGESDTNKERNNIVFSDSDVHQKDADENQTNVEMAPPPPKKCSNSPNYMTTTVEFEHKTDTSFCEHFRPKRKACRRGYDKTTSVMDEFECLCEPIAKQVSQCCICLPLKNSTISKTRRAENGIKKSFENENSNGNSSKNKKSSKIRKNSDASINEIRIIGNNEDSESDVSTSESEISVDSIDGPECCICFCPSKYSGKINGKNG